ncbi:MAG: cysteine desulfurase family protein [Chloroflexota bacterium]|nr:cysteine desulfurase family protein [Chloroflexota bacterium]
MTSRGITYLDHAGTTPTSPEVVEAMLPYFGHLYGNPSSVHTVGQEARHALDDARESVSHVLNCRTREIVFTSGGTESDNAAVHGAVTALQETGNHIITSVVEHHAVLHACQYMENMGCEVTYLPVDNEGIVHPEFVYNAITPNTTLVTLMYANNEIGSINPISDISKAVRIRSEELQRTIVMHTDAVQAAGFLSLDVQELGVDMLSLSGHKFYGPKGSGMLFLRRGTPFLPLMLGGGQERERRSGTENIAGIVGLSKALKVADDLRDETSSHCLALRSEIIERVMREIPCVRLNGGIENRLPNNINFAFDGVEGEAILLGLDMAGIAASSGSACSSGSLEPSHVLLALGQTAELARSSLRVTLGKQNTMEEINYFIKTLVGVVGSLRQMPTLNSAV